MKTHSLKELATVIAENPATSFIVRSYFERVAQIPEFRRFDDAIQILSNLTGRKCHYDPIKDYIVCPPVK